MRIATQVLRSCWQLAGEILILMDYIILTIPVRIIFQVYTKYLVPTKNNVNLAAIASQEIGNEMIIKNVYCYNNSINDN